MACLPCIALSLEVIQSNFVQVIHAQIKIMYKKIYKKLKTINPLQMPLVLQRENKQDIATM